MSAATTTTAAPSRGPLAELFLGGGAARRALWILVGLMLLLSVVRVIPVSRAVSQPPTRPRATTGAVFTAEVRDEVVRLAASLPVR